MARQKALPLIGGHVSAAGMLSNAITNGEAIGATCIQLFGSSPRQWFVRIPSPQEAGEFKTRYKNSRIKAVYLHAPYLVNIASPLVEQRKRSVTTLIGHFRIAEMIGANGLIFHLGSGKEMVKEEAITEAVNAMKEIIKAVPGESYLIMENSAGGGQKLAAIPEELGEMVQRVNSPRLKVCFDTAHAFEAGIISDYEPETIKHHIDWWDRAVGLDALVAIHANDSKTAFNSNNDRHENIGEGFIGMSGFKNLAKEKRLHSKHWMLEVPGFAGEGPDAKNVTRLRSCFK